ncbi:MAG: serine hydrolase [Bacteroidetes bacterium]|jgi:CubicO group peptidase (beta-lactamase class C family)|nr:serine hydrolase [Bacteroidota bacterium]
MQKIFLISLLAAIFSLQSHAQSPNKTAEVSAFKRAQQATVVLRNENSLLPLQRLDTLRIAYCYFGSGVENEFLPTLQQYAPITPVRVPSEVTGTWLEEQRSRFNLFILEMEEITRGTQAAEVFQMEDRIQPMLQQLPCLVYLYGEGFVFQAMPWLRQAQGIVVSPPNAEQGPSVAAQVIFGGLPARGSLLGPLQGTPYRRGDGARYKGLQRLAYTPAALVGMDQQLLQDSLGIIIEEGIQAGAFPGAQILVARRGKVVYHEAFGYHTSDSSRAVERNDLYDLASITKIASALPALMRLHGEEQFELDAPLRKYFPRYLFAKKGGIEFRPMLAHHARLRPWIPYWRGTLKGNARYPWEDDWDKERINDYDFRWRTFRRDSSKRYSIYVADDLWLHRKYKKRIYKAIRKSPLNEDPGYQYSGLLFYLLPEVVERIADEPYRDYLQQKLYRPLGAYTLGYQPLERFPKPQIVPTERDTFFRMSLLHGRVHDEGAAMMGGVSANAGLFSNANDLAKLMQLYLNDGRYGGMQLIDSASVAEFTRYQYREEGNRRGLGFDKPMLEYEAGESYIAEQASPQSFGHSGYTGTFTWADPKEELLIVFLSNRVFPTRANQKLYELDIRPRLHRAVYEAVQK